jgi:hypothetical protein
MAASVTNAVLNQLLLQLGFEPGHSAGKNLRVWTHPESECSLLLPINKAAERARPADLVGIKTQLDLHSHLDGESFDVFLAEGKLPAPSAE